jgi:hypothetical protein
MDRLAAATIRAWRLAQAARDERYRTILEDSVETLVSARIEGLLAGGAALGLTVYPTPVLRHCHEIEFLVRSEDVRTCADRLHARWGASSLVDADEGIVIVHASGLPLIISTRLRDPGADESRVTFDDLYAARELVSVGRQRIGALSRPDALARACTGLRPARPGVSSIAWALDVYYLLAADGGPDWSVLVDRSSRRPLALLLLSVLSGFAEEAHVRAPATAIEALARAAASTLRQDRAELLPTLAGAPRSLRTLRAMDAGWTTKCSVALMMLTPPVTPPGGRRDVTRAVPLQNVRRFVRWMRRAAANHGDH